MYTAMRSIVIFLLPMNSSIATPAMEGGDHPRAPGPSAQGGKHRVPLKAVGEAVHAEKRQGGVRRMERRQEKGPSPVPHGEEGAAPMWIQSTGMPEGAVYRAFMKALTGD